MAEWVAVQSRRVEWEELADSPGDRKRGREGWGGWLWGGSHTMGQIGGQTCRCREKGS